jgi:hypothetical protein
MEIRDFQEEIARLAYELFEVNGRDHGNDLANWFEAERLVISRHSITEEEKPKGKRTVGKPPGKKTTMKKRGSIGASQPASGKKKTTKA